LAVTGAPRAMPIGMRNWLAMQCWKPSMANAEIGSLQQQQHNTWCVQSRARQQVGNDWQHVHVLSLGQQLSAADNSEHACRTTGQRCIMLSCSVAPTQCVRHSPNRYSFAGQVLSSIGLPGGNTHQPAARSNT
jgi:hypothetical protein